MAKDFELRDYVEVPERIATWYQVNPDGRIVADPPQLIEVAGRLFISSTARVYRDPEDPRPSQGSAWEQYPGQTPYTRNSEAMNAETSAVGRALALAGISTKQGIASAQDVRNRRAEQNKVVAPAPAIAAIKARCQALDEPLRSTASKFIKQGPRIDDMTEEELYALTLWLDDLEAAGGYE